MRIDCIMIWLYPRHYYCIKRSTACQVTRCIKNIWQSFLICYSSSSSTVAKLSLYLTLKSLRGFSKNSNYQLIATRDKEMRKSMKPIIFDGTIGSKVDTKEMKHQKSVKCLGWMCVKWMTRQRKLPMVIYEALEK